MPSSQTVDLTDPSRSELLACARMLHDAGWLPSVEELFDFLEKPWKWQPEVQLWTDSGRPHAGGEGWDLFSRRLQRHEDDQG